MDGGRTLLVWAIILSLGLHIVGSIVPRWIPDSWLLSLQDDWTKPNEAVEFEVVDRSAKDEQQFVKSFDDEKDETDPEKLKEKARFLSDRLRRYKEELQASMLGETRNSAGLRGSRDSKTDFRPKFNPNQAPQREIDTFQGGDFEVGMRELDQRQAFNHEPRPSTIGETLPKDISKGMFNVLNTDYTTFYSFYERFGTMVRFNWARQLERISNDQGLRSTIMSSVNREWTTEMKVWLRPDGEILRVTIMKPSGIPILDRAHQRTFVDVGLVPNPPKEMVKDDGLISIDVALTVFYTPQPTVR